MLNEDPAPMTTHKSGTEAVTLEREMGGDEGKDIQQNAVDGSEEVLPFTDGYKCGPNVAFQSRNRVQVKATEVVSNLIHSGRSL
jgi:hypothetical protein